MHQLIIKPSAELDAMNAANWYNNRLDGLSGEFLFALEAKINEIRRNPKQYVIIYEKYPKGFNCAFPLWCIFYHRK